MAAARATVYVGLGANLGDAAATVRAALQALQGLPQTTLRRASALYRSAPLQAQGPPYVNAAAELATQLPPLQLLIELQAIENQHGRERPYHHAPRTLDLDLLLYGQQVLQLAGPPALVLPHPRLHLRAFVLRPLLDLAPQLHHPALGPLAALWPAVEEQMIERMTSADGGRS